MFGHETIASCLDLAVKVDRLNIKNLGCFEWLFRRTQLHEGAVLESPLQPSYEGARFYLGKGAQRGGALVMPSLTAHVASEIGRHAAILKEKRKAKEARQGGKNQKGDQKGNGPKGAGAGKGAATDG